MNALLYLTCGAISSAGILSLKSQLKKEKNCCLLTFFSQSMLVMVLIVSTHSMLQRLILLNVVFKYNPEFKSVDSVKRR